MTGTAKINLTADGAYSEWIWTAGKFLLSADIQPLSAFTWSTAIIGLEWSITKDDFTNAVTFIPAVTFTSSIKSRANINISGLPYVRFVVTTAEGANDPNAKIPYMCQ